MKNQIKLTCCRFEHSASLPDFFFLRKIETSKKTSVINQDQ